MFMRSAILLTCVIFISSAIAAAPAITTGGPGPEMANPAYSVSKQSPMAEITTFAGSSFDWQYMMSMYKQNAGIAAIAGLGTCRASSQLLRDISARIVREQLALTNGLEWASLKFTVASKPDYCTRRIEGLLGMLAGCADKQFDALYASTMLELLRQSAKAADRAILEADEGHLLAQAHATRRVSAEEAQTLKQYR